MVQQLPGFPHLVLTLDLKIQDVLEKLVGELIAGQAGVRAGAYLMEAGSGAMLASVQYPSFNPNSFREYSDEELASLFLEPLLLPIGYRRFLRDSANLQTQNEVTGAFLPWSIVMASDSLGSQLRLWDRIGLNETASPEFVEETSLQAAKAGLKEVSGGAGESFDAVPERMSPLHLLTAVASLLNGGEKIKAHAVSQLVDPVSKKEFPLGAKAKEHPAGKTVSAETSREILRLLSSQSKRGMLDSISYSDDNLVALDGKSSWALRQDSVLLTVIPADKPELVLLVVLEKPPVKPEVRIRQNGDLALAVDTVVQRIAVLQQVGMNVSDVVSPGEPEKINYTPGKDNGAEDRAIRVSALSEEEKVIPMPDLQGMSLRKALKKLQAVKVKVRIVGTGKIMAQSPNAGEMLTKNSECVLTLQKEEDIQLKNLEKKQPVIKQPVIKRPEKKLPVKK